MKTYKHSKEPELYHYFNTKNEKLWMFRHKYYDALGIRKEKKKSGFKTDKAALKALLEVKAQTLRGQTKQLDYENMTISQWIDIWYEMNKNKWKKPTRVKREGIIKNHIKPLLGHYKLQKLDKTIYKRDFINVLENKRKARTVLNIHNTFKIAINAAVEDEILPRNRFNNIAIKGLETVHAPLNYFTPEELTIFLNDVKEHENITIQSIFFTISYTGMRKGEAMGLQWKDINFDENTITVERTRDHTSTRTPKTKNSYRTIPVTESLMDLLTNYKKWCKETLFRFGKKLKEDDFIFILENSLPVHHAYPNVALKRSIKRTSLKEITVHGLRHTHATLLLNKKQDVKAIAERLGNTPDMIYSVYGHVLKELKIEAVSLFDESLHDVKWG